jgi:hypothetical protein
MVKLRLSLLVLVVTACIFGNEARAQRYLSDFDSSLFVRDTLRTFMKRFENLRFSGYIQPQFQTAQAPGTQSYNGGNFSTYSRNRFMLRRARVRIDYFLPTEDSYPKAIFTFQVDATERGVGLRDMFIKVYETKGHNFNATAGMFARPFGFEVNLSSQFREAPERGRMSQILMPSERDLGFMLTYDPLRKTAKNKLFKIDAGIFNGQGLSGPVEFDSYKDFISRITIKGQKIKKWELGGGLSVLYGGWRQATKYLYKTGTDAGNNKVFVVDSSITNIGDKAPRHYYGADMQVKLRHGWGESELRMEYWFGKQPGTATTTSNPGTLPEVPTYVRRFDGAFICFLQNIVNRKNQLIVKYDFYDPNTEVAGSDIGKTATNLTVADIKYSTIGIGFLRQLNENLRFIAYYDIVTNEKAQLVAYNHNLPDNVLTFRFHYRF